MNLSFKLFITLNPLHEEFFLVYWHEGNISRRSAESSFNFVHKSEEFIKLYNHAEIIETKKKGKKWTYFGKSVKLKLLLCLEIFNTALGGLVRY